MRAVDVINAESIRRQFKTLLPHIQTMPPDDKQKAFVAVAWTFARAGDIDEVLKLMDQLTPEYVQAVMPEQMSQDRSFDQMAEVVACALVNSGIHVPQYVAPDGVAVTTKAGIA